MTYQLVLQFSGQALTDYDSLIDLENGLIAILGDSADVDGHDFGSGQGNIFILTENPIATFENLRRFLAAREVLDVVVAAYRQLAADDYVVIWPYGFSGDFTVV